jgi:hypothetical protein
MYSLGPDELIRLGQKGKEFVKEFHNITFLSNEYVELFKKYLK